MTAAEQALRDLIDTLVEMRQYLGEHGQRDDFGFDSLGLIATEDPGPPEQTLRNLWRAGMRLGHRDGPWEVAISDGAGGVDQEANRRLKELKDRLSRILDEWGPPEREE